MPSTPYNNSPGYSTAYRSVGSCTPTVSSLRVLILFYSVLHLSFIQLLFHLHMLLFDHLYCWRTACHLLTYHTHAWSLQSTYWRGHLNETGTNRKYRGPQWLLRNEWRHCRAKIVLFTYVRHFLRGQNAFDSVEMHAFLNLITLGTGLCSITRPYPHHSSKLILFQKYYILR